MRIEKAKNKLAKRFGQQPWYLVSKVIENKSAIVLYVRSMRSPTLQYLPKVWYGFPIIIVKDGKPQLNMHGFPINTRGNGGAEIISTGQEGALDY